jgi:hypothetical protein
MAQQTAVEWFVEKITKNHDKDFNVFYKAEIEQAKQKEKEQIEDAWHDGKMLGVNGNIIESYDTPEGFYHKNYGQ